MKNTGTVCLVIIACMLVAFTGGFFIGRNYNHADVQISNLSTGSAVTAATEETENTNQTLTTSPSIVNINTATLEDLMSLPNIGPVLAQRIIDFREKYGDFKDVLDLGKVEGIGKKTLEGLLDRITVGG